MNFNATMAEPLGLENLPLECIEVIVAFLSSEDLTTCLTVSHSWYDVFSNDLFWKRFLTTNLSNYLSKTKSLVEPPLETNSSIPENRLKFLQEQHLYKNWNSWHCKEEILFHCTWTIRREDFVFFDNNHILINYAPLKAELWNVTETPFLVMDIPYCLKGNRWMMRCGVFKVVDNTLVVMYSHCIAVQVYTISLDSNSFSLSYVFCYNKPGKFSSNIKSETNVNDLFQLESIYSDDDDIEAVVCGDYFVGAYLSGGGPPELHVWNIKTGNKLKEEKCEAYKGFWIELTAPRKNINNKVLVTFSRPTTETCLTFCSIIYDLSLLQFVLDSQCCHSDKPIYFDGVLSVLRQYYSSVIVQDYQCTKNATANKQVISFPRDGFVNCVQRLGSNLLMSTNCEVYCINTSEMVPLDLENLVLIKVSFNLMHMEVLCDRIVILSMQNQILKEIWEVGKSLKKVREFPSNLGENRLLLPDSMSLHGYVASNNVGSKIILQKKDKLVILNFW